MRTYLTLASKVLLASFFALVISSNNFVLAKSKQKIPQRIVSTTLCVDQLVLSLANKEQILSVSYLSADKTISFFSERVEGLQKNRGWVEEIFMMKPDLVIVNEDSSRPSLRHLKKLGLNVLSLKTANNFSELKKNIKKVSRVVGDTGKAKLIISNLESKLRLEIGNDYSPLAAILLPRGMTAGEGSLINELVVSAGFKNLALDLKIGRQARINLEEILIARPDFILTPEASTKFPSLAQSMLLHPVFETTRAKNYRWKHLEVPEWAWLCGGLQNIYALDLLKKARLKFSGRVDQHD